MAIQLHPEPTSTSPTPVHWPPAPVHDVLVFDDRGVRGSDGARITAVTLCIAVTVSGSRPGVTAARRQLTAVGARVAPPASSDRWIAPAHDASERILGDLVAGHLPAGVRFDVALGVRGPAGAVEDAVTELLGPGADRAVVAGTDGELSHPDDVPPASRDTVAAQAGSLLRQGGLAMLLALGLQAVTNLVFHGMASRSLGPEEYGALGAVLAAMLALAVPLTSIQVAATRAVAELDGIGSARRTLGRCTMWSAVFAVAVMLATPLWLSLLHLDDPWLAASIGPYVAIATVGALARGVQAGRGRVATVAWSFVAASLARITLGVALVAPLGMTGAVIATLLGELAGTLVATTPILRSDRGPGPSIRLPGRDLAGTVVAVGGLLLFAAGDALVARHALPAADAGLYVAASNAVRVLLMAPQAILVVGLPRFVPHREHGGRAALAATLTVSVVAMTIGGVLLVAFDTFSLGLLFGQDFLAAAPLIPALAASMVAIGAVQILTYHDIARRSPWALLPWAGAVVGLVAVETLADTAAQAARLILGASLAQLAVSGTVAVLLHRRETAGCGIVGSLAHPEPRGAGLTVVDLATRSPVDAAAIGDTVLVRNGGEPTRIQLDLALAELRSGGSHRVVTDDHGRWWLGPRPLVVAALVRTPVTGRRPGPRLQATFDRIGADVIRSGDHVHHGATPSASAGATASAALTTNPAGSAPLRILVLSWRDPAHPAAGGSEVYLAEVSRSWSRDGHEVTWFSAAVDGAPDDEVLDGVRIIRRGSKLSVYREARRFTQAAAPGRYDLVIDVINTRPFGAHRFAEQGVVVGLAHQVAREVWFHETALPVALGGRFLLEPWWLRSLRDTPVLTVSHSSRRSLAHHGLRRLRVVPEGVHEPTHTAVTKADVPTVVFCGRLVPSKRPQDVLDAFHLVRHSHPDAELVVIGSGPLEERLRRSAPPGVRFAGWLSEAEKAHEMGRAHVLVATSVREGWGLVVSEAAALGTPTVAYDVDGLRDSVAASGGVLCEPTPRSLADALDELLPSWQIEPPALDRLGGALRWDDVAARVLDTALRELARPAPTVTP